MQYLYSYLQTLSKEQLLDFNLQALEIMNPAQLDFLLGDAHFKSRLIGCADEEVLGLLYAFDHKSRVGDYYRTFCLDSKSFGYLPPETEIWYAEITRWLNYGCNQASAGNSQHAFDILSICVLLLDDVADAKIVFADELGDWMLGTKHDFRKILEEIRNAIK